MDKIDKEFYYKRFKRTLKIDDNEKRFNEMMNVFFEMRREVNTIKELTEEKKFYCILCQNSYSLKDTYFIDQCSHRVCKYCFAHHCNSTINSNSIFITCPFDGCETKITNTDKICADGLIPKHLHVKYQDKLLKWYYQSNGYIKCPLCKQDIPHSKDMKVKCVYCQEFFCINCQCKYHDDFTCNEYQKYKNMEPFIQKLYKYGLEFIKKEQKQDYSLQGTLVQFNLNILKNCPCMKRFFKGSGMTNKSSINPQDGFFAWHGSSEYGVKGICYEGFDPGRRSGQAYGPGEYFGRHASVSAGYVRDGCHMILTFIIKNDKTSSYDWGYVVDNPKDWKSSFCLPLFVLSYGHHKTVDYLPGNVLK